LERALSSSPGVRFYSSRLAMRAVRPGRCMFRHPVPTCSAEQETRPRPASADNATGLTLGSAALPCGCPKVMCAEVLQKNKALNLAAYVNTEPYSCADSWLNPLPAIVLSGPGAVQRQFHVTTPMARVDACNERGPAEGLDPTRITVRVVVVGNRCHTDSLGYAGD
jgi:hypothetical protein